MTKISDRDVFRIRKLMMDVLSEPDCQHIERLGGLTNHTYKIELTDGRAFVVRLPGEGTEELINRTNERISMQLARELGMDAQILHIGARGEKVTCYIAGAQTMSISSFGEEKVLQKAVRILRDLHGSGADTKVPFDVFDMAEGYEAIISDNAVTLFDDYAAVKTKVMEIRSYVEKHGNVALVPCHNDPVCENWVMDQEGKLYLIDWEYAGMNDRMWDLAAISIEAAFSSERENVLLRLYLGWEPEPEEWLRFHANKLYVDFLWALWGKARAPFAGKDMEEYGMERYLRLKKNLKRFEEQFPIEK